MKYNVNKDYILQVLSKIINIPSPVGYTIEIKPVLCEIASQLGLTVTTNNKNTAYISLDGQDNSKTVLLSAHVDTLGFVVRSINADGTLALRSLGGGCMPSYEGESVTVITRDGRKYTGLIICKSHSAHVFKDTHTLERTTDTLRVLLDEDVKNVQDVKNLGIQNGDIIAVDPRFTITQNGYIKSRHIDDKGGVACIFAMLKYLNDNKIKPKYKTIIAFPCYEEVGLGGCFVPEEVSEFIAVDIGLIGPELDGNEYSVSICAKDASMPYDYELTTRLIEYAKKAECSYAVDVYYRYGSDSGAALKAGNDIATACLGMAVYCSHGLERTHIDGLLNTTNLLLGYVLDI